MYVCMISTAARCNPASCCQVVARSKIGRRLLFAAVVPLPPRPPRTGYQAEGRDGGSVSLDGPGGAGGAGGAGGGDAARLADVRRERLAWRWAEGFEPLCGAGPEFAMQLIVGKVGHYIVGSG